MLNFTFIVEKDGQQSKVVHPVEGDAWMCSRVFRNMIADCGMDASSMDMDLPVSSDADGALDPNVMVALLEICSIFSEKEITDANWHTDHQEEVKPIFKAILEKYASDTSKDATRSLLFSMAKVANFIECDNQCEGTDAYILEAICFVIANMMHDGDI